MLGNETMILVAQTPEIGPCFFCSVLSYRQDSTYKDMDVGIHKALD